MADDYTHDIPTFFDFFAGSGLVSEALKEHFAPVGANDICAKKAAVFRANHTEVPLLVRPIEEINGTELPETCLSWASFPCQDLSLAGKMAGLSSARSGLVWQWLRVMDEMTVRPQLAVAENVVGLISGAENAHYIALHSALVSRGYKVGSVILDAAYWVPQSRKRVFVVAVQQDIDTEHLEAEGPRWCHPASLCRCASNLEKWVWWSLPKPRPRRSTLEGLIDPNAPCDSEEKSRALIDLIPPRHRERMEAYLAMNRRVFPGYKRIRKGKQVLELRFDGLAGCLRTARGGSSRQFLVIRRNGSWDTRLLTVKEAAALMGVRASYRIPGSYNAAYGAMGDAVAVPAVRYLAQHLLRPLADAATESRV